MAIWKFEKCGHEKEGRCKLRKCPECSEAGSFAKKEKSESAGCGCSCSSK